MANRACGEFREMISAFVDGESSREDDARLRQHFATCEDCRATLDSYRSISTIVRNSPNVHPPIHLTESIYAQTIDAEPRRLFLMTSRLGYSLAAVASVLLIFVVAGYLIIGGYERGIEPTVASSAPAHSPTPDQPIIWPLQRPVEIKFNKEMNQESVIAALGMQPPQEKNRLSHSWDGNTLIIGGNPTFKPNTNYEIKISTDATDKWGNPLKEPFRLAFTTSSSQSTIQTPTPVVIPSATPTTEEPIATSDATPSATSDDSTADDDATATPSQPETNTPTSGDGNGTTDGTGVPGNPVGPTATPTPTPSGNDPPLDPTQPAQPTATATATPTATMTPVPPTATATATATAIATATATTPAAPTATATPDSIPVIGAIGDVYWRDQTVQDRLGAPLEAAFTYDAQQLDFQRGVMLLDESQAYIYVLKFGAGWESWAIPAGDQLAAELGPEPDIYIPGQIFGDLWRSDATLQEDVGFALSEYAISYPATVQDFEHGRMIATRTTVYVIYNDHSWDWFTYSAGS